MPLQTFIPPMRPSPGTGRGVELALNKTPFGDGYTQASPRGLNSVRRVITLKWDFLSLDEARQIENFMIARGGYQPFYYTLNGEATPRKWTCETWTVTDDHPSKVSLTLKENFTTAT